jgi:hypothetical protein
VLAYVTRLSQLFELDIPQYQGLLSTGNKLPVTLPRCFGYAPVQLPGTFIQRNPIHPGSYA